jgi:hemoglobin-like flavoprotein
LADGTTAASIYTTLAAVGTTDAQISAITSAFSKIASFASVQTVAAQEHKANIADAALTKAVGALSNLDGDNDATTITTGDAWKAAYDKLAADTAKLDASKSVDALVAKYGSR